MDNQIKSVCARQIFDSKCRPIIEVDVITEGGVLGRGSASTGTSVGMYEAVILVDGDPNRFGGKSVYHAIDNVNNIIGPAIIGMDVTDQAAIDRRMIELDGTPNKSKLGGNAIYATSIACIKAAARTQHMELYRYIAGGSIKTIPIPTFNSINGGTYGKFCMGIHLLPLPRGEHGRGRGDRDEGLPHDRSGHHRIPARQTGKGRTLLRLGAAHGGPGRCHAAAARGCAALRL